MTDIHAYDAPASGAAPEAGFGDYVALLKPRVMSLVVFTALGDRVTVSPGKLSLTVTGPFAGAVPPGDDKLCLRAAQMVEAEAAITARMPGCVCVSYGHVGDGNFHVIFSIDPARPEEFEEVIASS